MSGCGTKWTSVQLHTRFLRPSLAGIQTWNCFRETSSQTQFPVKSFCSVDTISQWCQVLPRSSGWGTNGQWLPSCLHFLIALAGICRHAFKVQLPGMATPVEASSVEPWSRWIAVPDSVSQSTMFDGGTCPRQTCLWHNSMATMASLCLNYIPAFGGVNHSCSSYTQKLWLQKNATCTQ